LIEEQGHDAVKAHAEETGMLDFIRLVQGQFTISNVAIYSPGKYTYTHDRPVKRHTVIALEGEVPLRK
jgi:hypothetical protein